MPLTANAALALPGRAPQSTPGLRDAAGRPVALGPRLGAGGEGEVFDLPGEPGLVAKVFAPGRRAGKAAKLRAMLAAPPLGAHDLVEGLPVLTWPRGLLLDGRGDVAGYTMARVQPDAFVPFHQVTGAARRQGLGGQPLTWDKLVLLGLRLAHMVRTLHRFGYAVGDLNDRNVLVSRRLTPLLMDTDSFQVGHGRGMHPCTVGDAQYWPPELLDVDLARRPVDREGSDRYALGVLLFQLLMAGLRPYQARGRLVEGLATAQDKARAGHYPWAQPRAGELEPPKGAPDYGALPAAIRAAFEACFVAGHAKPARRPTAEDWVRVLAGVRDAGSQSCPREPRHVYAREARRCPWCADPNDPFTDRPSRARPARAPPSPRIAVQPRPKPRAGRPKGAPQRPLQHSASPSPQPAKVAPPPAATPPVRKAKRAARPARSPARGARRAPRRPAKAKPKAKGPAKGRKPRGRQPSWRSNARWLAVLTSALATAWLLAP